jgi:hypothetical protein
VRRVMQQMVSNELVLMYSCSSMHIDIHIASPSRCEQLAPLQSLLGTCNSDICQAHCQFNYIGFYSTL